MKIDCIADLHGHQPILEGGDLLIIAGDLTASDKPIEFFQFFEWLNKQNYTRIILIAGNHDMQLQNNKILLQALPSNTTYLRDTGTAFGGLTIWGSPWTPRFVGCSPKCKAYMHSDKYLRFQWNKIPENIDILVTHGPPFGSLDGIPQVDGSIYHAGCQSLRKYIMKRETLPKIWIYGHIHEGYGEQQEFEGRPFRMINCSHVNEKYKPVNSPIRINL